MFGIWNHPEAGRMTYFGLHALQHRGQDGAGMSVVNDGTFKSYRGTGLLSEVFNDSSRLKSLAGNKAIGQIHYAMSGQRNDIDNIGPFLFHFHDQDISVTHSGNVTNSRSLRKELEKEGAVFHSTSDSELLVHLIRRSKQETFEGRLAEAVKQLRGGFNFLVLTEETMYGVVDPNCFRPLSYGRTREGGSTVIASETCAFHATGTDFIDNVRAGHYIVVTDEGIRTEQYETDTKIAIEAMEYIYFARPDSEFAGINVHSARKNLGRQLAKEQPCPDADMVIGVPNSSLSAATGYAEASGLPYEMGLVKNQYVGRTFIEPTKELREQGVRKKLTAVRGVVENKSIVLVDDSIVRGTTSKRLVQLLREAGAREIHLRITSPPIRFPNYYGVDMSSIQELMAAHYTVEEMTEIIGCDSLGFLSVDGVIEGVGTTFDAPNKGLSLSIFNGDYPADLGDYGVSLAEQMTPIQKKVLRGEL
ncbi:amidophosphoribosyltransferase [Atopococcus tabaci]|uniref:amidophosphoribosyltransferase n=1 Tax=Atopococcus tabaci TaxID=269774 RepID=UPI00240A4A4F|nr:amidophosphoribosyltransferase [Atopococcus tabaci]